MAATRFTIALICNEADAPIARFITHVGLFLCCNPWFACERTGSNIDTRVFALDGESHP